MGQWAWWWVMGAYEHGHWFHPHYPLHHPPPHLWRRCNVLLIEDCNPTWLQICKQLLVLALLQCRLLQHQEHVTLQPHARAYKDLALDGA